MQSSIGHYPRTVAWHRTAKGIQCEGHFGRVDWLSDVIWCVTFRFCSISQIGTGDAVQKNLKEEMNLL